MIRIGLPDCSSCAKAGIEAVSAPASKSPAAETRRTKGVIATSLSFCPVLLFGQQRSHDPLPRQRQVADALAQGAGERVADGGPGRADRGFAETQGRLVR